MFCPSSHSGFARGGLLGSGNRRASATEPAAAHSGRASPAPTQGAHWAAVKTGPRRVTPDAGSSWPQRRPQAGPYVFGTTQKKNSQPFFLGKQLATTPLPREGGKKGQ